MTGRRSTPVGEARSSLISLLSLGLWMLLSAPAGAQPGNLPRNDDADSPYVPKGYRRTFTENFPDSKMVFNATDNASLTTANFRLNAKDLNTCRRLVTNGERQLYFDQDFAFNGTKFGINPFSISGGILSITANPLSDVDKAALAPLTDQGRFKPVLYSSGMLSTETQLRKPGQGFDQLYGYWELRARLPRGKGLWSAFWLVNENWQYWNEIDVFEVLGDAPRNIYQTTHFKDGGGTDGMTGPQHTYTGIDPTDGFHVYGLQMTTDHLFFFVDGKQTLKLSHKLHDPFYTILNLAVGGNWPKDPDATTKFPASFDIDYLRIYQQPK